MLKAEKSKTTEESVLELDRLVGILRICIDRRSLSVDSIIENAICQVESVCSEIVDQIKSKEK